MNKLSKMPRAEQWADRIRTELGKTVDSIMEVGRLLLKAKSDLAHGEWGRMFEDKLIPLTQNTAGIYMKIASHPVLSNSEHAQNLPPSWFTLYELTKLSEPTLKHALRDGLITPDMERKHVQALQQPAVRTAPAAPSPTLPRDEVLVPELVARELVNDVVGMPTPRRQRPSAPSNGLQFARIAIMKLEEIQDDDVERQQAFALVRSWLNAREA